MVLIDVVNPDVTYVEYVGFMFPPDLKDDIDMLR